MAMNFFHQKKWRCIDVVGDDRQAFLQNLLTQDLAGGKVGETAWACLLTGKSKLIALMGVVIGEEKITLCLRAELVAQVMQVLDMYTIIQDVRLQISDVDVFFALSTGAFSCTLENPETLMTDDAFEQARIAAGFPLYGQDYHDPLPLEVPFMHAAISYNKGCYVGQETIARLHARGMHVSRMLCRVKSQIPFAVEDQIYVGQEVVGQVSSVVKVDEGGYMGLSWIKRKGFDQELALGGGNALQVIAT